MSFKHGTRQEERDFPALAQGYLKIANLPMPRAMSLTVEYAALLKFFNLNNEHDGYWDDLFLQDESFLLALIISCDISAMEAEFLHALELGDNPESKFNKLIAQCLVLIESIDIWFKRFSSINSKISRHMSQRLAELMFKNSKTVSWLMALHAELLHDRDECLEHQFSDTWFTQDYDKQKMQAEKQSALAGNESDFIRIQLKIKRVFFELAKSISSIAQIANTYFEESFPSANHDPAVANYLAFIKLHQQIQNKINRFSNAFIDHYHYDHLKALQDEYSPDYTFLQLTPSVKSKDVLIPEGNQFIAGKYPDGEQIVFQSKCATNICHISVDRVASLFQDKDPHSSPESDFGFVTDILIQDICQPQWPLQTPIPLFGAAKERKAIASTARANVGFAISSRCLLLDEGKRNIEISIYYSECGQISDVINNRASVISEQGEGEGPSALFAAAFKQNILGQRDLYYRMFSQICAQGNEDFPVDSELIKKYWGDPNDNGRYYFYQYFKNLFTIQISSEAGWYTIKDYGFSFIEPNNNHEELRDVEQAGFRIKIDLPESCPSIVSEQEAIHGSEFESDYPIIKFLINHSSRIFAYSLLQDIKLSRIEIDANVDAIKNVSLANDYGLIDSSKPFQPFGPIPRQGGYFVFGNYQMAKKKLSHMSLDIEWAELPPGAGGFTSHYKFYPGQYSNDCFRYNCQLLKNSRWHPEESSTLISSPMFTIDNDTAKLNKRTRIEIYDVDKMSSIANDLPESNYQYSNRSRNGFVKINLVAPEHAFGHKQYPSLLAQSLTQNLKKVKTNKTLNEPYTPVIQGVSLNYRATETIDFRIDSINNADVHNKFYHIYPFGVASHNFNVGSSNGGFAMMPDLGSEGNLYLGISGNPGERVVSLFFELDEDCELREDNAQNLKWYFLSNDRWLEIEAINILSDTTDSLLHSGIITLKIPSEIRNNNRKMPANYYWLRVSTRGDVSRFASLKRVCGNVVQVERVPNNRNENNSGTNIVRGSISQSRSYLPGVKSISQLVDSVFPSKHKKQNHTRTYYSERLRHKNRAITAWDYERIVLERFPQVEAVKCFPNSIYRNANGVNAGHILLCVLPKAWDLDEILQKAPTVNGQLLREIKCHLQALAPSSAVIEVKNPLIDQIKIQCKVKLVPGISQGYASNKLNQEINRYICPWIKGNHNEFFNWSIRKSEMESFIRQRDYVEYVTNFSMLKLSCDTSGKYCLHDTARLKEDKIIEAGKLNLMPTYPWSIAQPTRFHLIEFIPENRPSNAKPTGINRLEISENFVVS